VKIGLAVRHFGPVGGMEGVAHGFAQWLVSEGHDADLWTADISANTDGLRVREFRAFGRGVLWKAHSLRRALREIPTGEYDGFVHFERGGRGGTYRAGAGCHATWVSRRGVRVGDGWLTALDHKTMHEAERVVVNSEMVRDEIVHQYGVPLERIRLVRNGVDLNRFRPGPQKDDPTILFPGGERPRKGLFTALEALRLIPSARMVVLGEVSARAHRWAQSAGVAGRVDFVGRVDDPEKHMASAHVVVLPTRYDPSSNVVLEAMACGVPPVTTEYDGAAELLPHPWMAIADPTDAKACAEVLVAVMNEQKLGPMCRVVAEAHGHTVGYAQLLQAITQGPT
jgi:UDP-glucose:(heptosyl)LPS alpha-1,3-glucosyltransferase